MSLTIAEIRIEINEFEARPTNGKADELSENIDYLILEEHMTKNDRKTLKELKSRVRSFDFNKPTNQHLLTNAEIFAKQKRLIYDCEKLGFSTAGELDRQNTVLEASKDKTYKIDGKLIGSAGLLVAIKRTMQMNVAMLRIVVYMLILIFLVILMMKIFG